MNNRSFLWRCMACLLLMLMAGSLPSYAALNLTVGDVKGHNGNSIADSVKDSSLGLIDARWSNMSGSDPSDTNGKLKLADSVATFNSDPASTNPDGYYGYEIAEGYYFWRGPNETDPGAKVYIRVWESNPNQQGSYYSAVSSFDNGAQAATSGTLNAITDYKAEAPYKPVINKVTETVTTNYPSLTKSSGMTVYSAQPAPTDGRREVTSYQWSVVPAPKGDPNLTSQNLELSQDQIVAGTTYTFRVSHNNWFSVGDNWSDPVTYTAGAGAVEGPVAGGAVSFDFALAAAETDKLIVNMIALPSNSVSAGGTQATVNFADDLAQFINTYAGKNIVAAIYKFDAAAGKPYMAAYNEDGGSIDGSVNFEIKAGEGLQVYTREDLDISIQGR